VFVFVQSTRHYICIRYGDIDTRSETVRRERETAIDFRRWVSVSFSAIRDDGTSSVPGEMGTRNGHGFRAAVARRDGGENIQGGTFVEGRKVTGRT